MTLALIPALCASPPVFNTSIHLFSDSMHVPTGDSDLHDVIGLCVFLQLFLECVHLHAPVCFCLSTSLFVSVNALGLTARKPVLQRKE